MIECRPPMESDAESLFPLIFQTQVTDTILWDGPDSLDSYRQSLGQREAKVATGESHFFTIVERSSGSPIGNVSLRPDEENFRGNLGLWIGLPYQGKGHGTEVVAWMLAYGFLELGLEKIEAEVFVGNWPSRRIFEKNGFVLEGTIRCAVRKRGRPIDEWILGITKADFERGRQGD